MSAILVAYGTGEGQTGKIARFVATALESRGHETTVREAGADVADVAVDAFDAVIVGSAIHFGRHGRSVVRFVDEHRDVLEDRPSAFFQVSLSSASDDIEGRTMAMRYLEEFTAMTGWSPDQLAAFAGALQYSEYGFLERLVVKRMAGNLTGDTDTSRDYEYTDWAAVDAFVDDFATHLDADEDGDGVGVPLLDATPDTVDEIRPGPRETAE